MNNFSVTQYGKPLDPTKYTWAKKTKTFFTQENNLVLDFSNYNSCTFTTGSECTFTTGSECTFTTGFGCTFTTGYECVLVRRDIFEIHQLVENETIKLNNYHVPGFAKVVENKDEILSKLVEKLKILSVEDLKNLLK